MGGACGAAALTRLELSHPNSASMVAKGIKKRRASSPPRRPVTIKKGQSFVRTGPEPCGGEQLHVTAADKTSRE